MDLRISLYNCCMYVVRQPSIFTIQVKNRVI